MPGIASKANLPLGIRSCQRWRERRAETWRGKCEPPVTSPAAPSRAAGRTNKQEGMSDRGVDNAVKPTVLL